MMLVSIITRCEKLKTVIQRNFFTYIARLKIKNKGAGLKVNRKSYFYGLRHIKLGSNVNFNGITIYGTGGLTIGNNFHSGRDCKIITVNHNFEGDEIPYDSTQIKKQVTIEDNVWLGDNAIILPGAHIKEGAIIGAGAVVRGEIERYGIAIGNPANVVKYRDKIHYEKLKRAKKFH
jgi:acetyltransferase-like isoleucine patch superfamily enzyme